MAGPLYPIIAVAIGPMGASSEETCWIICTMPRPK